MSSTSYDSSSEGGPVGEAEEEIAVISSLSSDRSDRLPSTPVTVIKPSKPWSPLNFRDLWAYRELLGFLIWRDIKVRYKQTLLGVAWAIIQPLAMMLIFTFFFGQLAQIPTEGIPSGLFYYSGLSLWMFFSNSAISGANSLIGNTNLITKVYFPRLVIPSAAVGAGIIDFAIASLLLFPMLLYFDFSVTWKLLMLVPIFVGLALLTLGTGVLFSALNAKYRDVRHALPFLLQIWMFVSPIIYPSSIVPQKWRWIIVLNPLTGLIEGYRAALFDRPIVWGPLVYALVFAVILLSIAAYSFRRMERSFAEVI